MAIVRKPILTAGNRRNVDNHPEFLDDAMLIDRFGPLIKSIYRKFVTYNGVFTNGFDREDLYDQIVIEFLRLHRQYDPKRGVDFVGYIKFHLQQRVYHYVMAHSNRVHRELNLEPATTDDDDSDEYLDLAGRIPYYDDSIDTFDSMSSINWESMSDEQRELASMILDEHLTSSEVARRKHMTCREVDRQVNELCDLVYDGIYGDSDGQTAYSV